MGQRKLWVLDRVIVNIVEYPDDATELVADEGVQLFDAAGTESVGDSFVVEEAVSQVIAPVTRRQMLTALHRLELLETIETNIKNSTDKELQIAYYEAADFERDNAMLVGMARILGFTDEQLDIVFLLAASL